MARAHDGAGFHMPSNTRVNLPTFGSALGHAAPRLFPGRGAGKFVGQTATRIRKPFSHRRSTAILGQ